MICMKSGMAQSERRNSIMDRYTITMRQKHLEFLQCSFKEELCFALLCPDQTHEKDLKPRML